MTMKSSKYYVLFLILCFGCLNSETNQKSDPQTIISTDIDALKTIINLHNYQPQHVEWKYWTLGNQSNERMSVPGPTDYALEAKLVFDSETIERIKKDYLSLSTQAKTLSKDSFRFDWITKTDSEQIENSNLVVYDAFLFHKDALINGKFIILDEQSILLYLYTT